MTKTALHRVMKHPTINFTAKHALAAAWLSTHHARRGLNECLRHVPHHSLPNPPSTPLTSTTQIVVAYVVSVLRPTGAMHLGLA
jgi:hypothetical protein